MALELVCYRIRLSFSHFIKHAKPFEINISLVAPPGPHRARHDEGFLFIYQIKRKVINWIVLSTQMFSFEFEALIVHPIKFA